jgi:hypothetical protein
VSAAAPVVGTVVTGWLDLGRTIATPLALPSEDPPVRWSFAGRGRCRAGLPELEVL